MSKVELTLEQYKAIKQAYHKQREALKEVEKITRGLGQFNPTYDKIHQIVKEALEGTE